jgi:hypothetical protein
MRSSCLPDEVINLETWTCTPDAYYNKGNQGKTDYENQKQKTRTGQLRKRLGKPAADCVSVPVFKFTKHTSTGKLRQAQHQ